jgi:hypothetical protein
MSSATGSDIENYIRDAYFPSFGLALARCHSRSVPEAHLLRRLLVGHLRSRTGHLWSFLEGGARHVDATLSGQVFTKSSATVEPFPHHMLGTRLRTMS